MGGKASRSKGARAEREFRDRLREYGIDAHRVPGSGSDKTLPWHGDIRGMDSFHIEVKRQESFAIHAALRQAKQDAPEGLKHMVAFRRNNEDWHVVLPFDQFMEAIGYERQD